MNDKTHDRHDFTLGHKALGWVGREPGLAVSWLIQLLYELKLTWYLSIIVKCQSFCLMLHELHFVEIELKETLEEENALQRNSKNIAINQIYSHFI